VVEAVLVVRKAERLDRYGELLSGSSAGSSRPARPRRPPAGATLPLVPLATAVPKLRMQAGTGPEPQSASSRSPDDKCSPADDQPARTSIIATR
jgi:hypothetical protein